MAAKGFGAEETMLALNRALKLCHSLNAPPQIFPVLSGLVGAHLMRGEIESARELAQDLLNCSKQERPDCLVDGPPHIGDVAIHTRRPQRS